MLPLPHLAIGSLALAFSATIANAQPIRVLFLGDSGHHRPAERADQVLVEMHRRGVQLHYTADLGDLNSTKLQFYDCILLYANHPALPKRNEHALLDFVDNGGGLIAVHCASYCFRNSRAFVELVGAQFKRHGTEVVHTIRPPTDHAIMRGLPALESFDETYVHHRHNPDRTVLEFRPEGNEREPWTWVRQHGKGRVFYTAWGHDQRTWSKPAFHELLERAIRWCAGDEALNRKPDPLVVEHRPARVPLYRHGQGQGDDIARMQLPLDAETSMRRLVVPPEFRVDLFASEPAIRKPIAIAWDHRGRAWIAETVDYPNGLKDARNGQDRITICEDVDGDGRADKFTVFAEQLSIPTSFVFVRDGIIVAQAPDFLMLRDTDGDDRADQREVLFTGWNTNDTHAGPSNLRFGLDNRIWGTVGYAGFDGRVGGVEHRFRQGIFRLDTNGTDLEFIASTTNNTWGLGLTEDGHVFASTANGNPSVFTAIPNRLYERVRGLSPPRLDTIATSTRIHPVTENVRQVDWHGQFTAAAGHAFYTARAFPEKYWNRAAFVAAPTGHLLHTFFAEPRGTHFATQDGFNLLASDDEWTAPIVAEVGPDGSVWVIDWYNFIVQHNPTPRGFERGKGNAYVTPLRDKRHGRIYRVSARDAPRSVRHGLGSASGSQLVAALRDDNLFWRSTAQRKLVERAQRDVVPELEALLTGHTLDPIGLDAAALHAVWTLAGLGALTDASRHLAVLDHPSHAVRRAGLRALPRTHKTRDAILARGLLASEDPWTRLDALLALADMPTSDAVGRAVLLALRDPANLADRHIPNAATIAAAHHDAAFLGAVLSSDLSAAPATRQRRRNLLPNPSFEDGAEGEVTAWRVRHYSGRAKHRISGQARTGSRSLMIESGDGADSSWFVDVDVEPGTTYELSGWIKTVEVARASGGAQGGLFNAHELQGRDRVQTDPLVGSNDWRRVRVEFSTRDRHRIGINCLFGGWGHATGTVLFDDVALVRTGAPRLPGKLGQSIALATRRFAERAPIQGLPKIIESLGAASPGLADAVLTGLAEGWPNDTAARIDDATTDRIRELLEQLEVTPAIALFELCRRWQLEDRFDAARSGIESTLRHRLADSAEARVNAAAQLLDLSPTRENVVAVLDSITPSTELDLAVGLVEAVGACRSDRVGALLVARWPDFTPRLRAAAVAVLLTDTRWTLQLLRAITARSVDRSEISEPSWHALRQHSDPDIRGLATRMHDSPPTDRSEIVEALLPVAEKRGDAARGRAVYDAHCALCHVIDGKGGQVGPSLTGIGDRSRADVLVDILDPNRSVEGNYQLWTVTTRDGRAFAGRLEAETRTSIEIMDLAGSRHRIERSDIESMRATPMSIMPATFDALGEAALTDLLEFLAQSRGR